MEISERELRALVRAVDDHHRAGMDTVADDIAELRARRRFLRTAGLTAVMAVGQAVLPVSRLLSPAAAQEAPQEEPDDADLAAFAESVELAVVKAYETAAGSGRLMTAAVLDAAGVFRNHHAEHARAFAQAAGGKAKGQPNARLLQALMDQFGQAAAENDVVKVAYDTENAAASTYLFALGVLTGPAALKLTASILPVESRHAVVLGQVLGRPTEELTHEGFESQDKRLDPADYPIEEPAGQE